MVVGIVGYGAHIPRRRIKVEEIAKVWGADAPSYKKGLQLHEKSVPGADEDTITLSVEATRNALARAGDLEGAIAKWQEAIAIANDTDFGLTGGLVSRSRERLERARREFKVGNLYLNRPITGARVGRQPWGGFRLSGSGTKSGGPDYLLHFVEPRCISENTMRSGFAPEL